jgi:DNA-binding IclR family transcriptional regulator
MASSPAVGRAAAVLDLLADAPRVPLGPSELARRIGAPKSTVLNICAELVASGLLRRVGSGYALGRKLVELGNAYLAGVVEVEEFYALCRTELPDERLTAQLAVLGEGDTVVYVARHDGTAPLHLGLAAEIGRSVPAHCTAAGKALLAALPPGSLAARLPSDGESLDRPTPHAAADTRDAHRRITAARQAGYAVDDEEILPGLHCLGVAVITPRRDDGLIAVSFTARTSNGAIDPAALRRFAAAFAHRIGGELVSRQEGS